MHTVSLGMFFFIYLFIYFFLSPLFFLGGRGIIRLCTYYRDGWDFFLFFFSFFFTLGGVLPLFQTGVCTMCSESILLVAAGAGSFGWDQLVISPVVSNL